MLIAYNNNTNLPNTSKQPRTNNKPTADEGATPDKPQAKKRFQNIRNGLTKSNRKLLKPDLASLSAAEPQAESTTHKTNHLQLIVSKCRCEFYMIDFEDKIGDDEEQFSVVATGLSASPTQRYTIGPRSLLDYYYYYSKKRRRI